MQEVIESFQLRPRRNAMNDTINLSTFVDANIDGDEVSEVYSLTSMLYMQAMKAKEEYPAQVALHLSDFETSYPPR